MRDTVSDDGAARRSRLLFMLFQLFVLSLSNTERIWTPRLFIDRRGA
jgi:hypothetical protein